MSNAPQKPQKHAPYVCQHVAQAARYNEIARQDQAISRAVYAFIRHIQTKQQQDEAR